MKFVWQEEKNQQLKKERSISFEEIIFAIENKQVVDVMEHPNKEKYKNQKILLVEIKKYIYVVPLYFSDSTEECHLITIYPSRKYTSKYLGEKK